MPSASQNEYAQVWDKLHETITREDWRGYDPYDGLNSPLARVVPLKPWRQAWIQFHKRCPFNLRPLVGIHKHVNPKALALGVSALCLRYRTLGHHELLGEAAHLALRMLELRSAQRKQLAWGYPFDWQSRAFFAPAGTPNMICTVFGANALLDLYEATNQQKYLYLATQCAEFILKDLPRTERADAFCFSYTPLDRSCVHNVNLLGAATVARAGRLGQRFEWVNEVKPSVRFSLGAQREDGSWPYGEADNQTWVDGFHTGYNLVALKQYQDNSGDPGFQPHLDRGWHYYRDHFFLDDGTPKYYNHAVYPIDVHSAAQGIITFLDIARDRAGAERIARWTLDHLWDGRGHFHFQKTRLWTNRVPYLRWSEAWMLLSLAKLLQLAR
jgi:hypothetical protein